MRRIPLLMLLTLALLCPVGYAQMLHPCFDLDGSGQSNISDLVYFSEVLVGNLPPPPGQGDIDGRDGVNLGDSRYFTGWIFFGISEGSCPPHPPYTISPGNDSIFLGSAAIPAGDGQVQIPVLLKSQNLVSDILLPISVNTTSGSASITAIEDANPDVFNLFNRNYQAGSHGVFQASGVIDDIPDPGIHLVANVTVDYTGSSGGVVSLDTTTLSSLQFPHYVHGDVTQGGYANTTIAIPAIKTGPSEGFPTMTADPDSLYFETLVGYPNPDPQSFTVNTDGGVFGWVLTHQSWLQVTPTSGVSGQSVDVSPDITSLGVGLHHGTIILESTEALGSPQVVDVYVKLKPQYPSFDANCDGNFSISDVVMQINYIFGGGELPCNPCTGEPQLKK